MTERAEARLDGTTLIVRIPMRFQRRGGRKRIVAPDGSEIVSNSKPQPDSTLVKALARAWRWQKLLDAGVHTSITDIAEAEGVNPSYLSRVLRLNLLAPQIVEMLLDGQQPAGMRLRTLLKPLPAEWARQTVLFAVSP